MQAIDPTVSFFVVIAVGAIAGFLFDRFAGPSWLARQFAGSSRGMVTSALVGIAGAFLGYHLAVILSLGSRAVLLFVAAALGAAIVLLGWRTVR